MSKDKPTVNSGQLETGLTIEHLERISQGLHAKTPILVVATSGKAYPLRFVTLDEFVVEDTGRTIKGLKIRI